MPEILPLKSPFGGSLRVFSSSIVAEKNKPYQATTWREYHFSRGYEAFQMPRAELTGAYYLLYVCGHYSKCRTSITSFTPPNLWVVDNVMSHILQMRKLKLIQDHLANKEYSQDSSTNRPASGCVLLTSAILLFDIFIIQSSHEAGILCLFGQMKELMIREVK